MSGVYYKGYDGWIEVEHRDEPCESKVDGSDDLVRTTKALLRDGRIARG